jgi:quercetin dioxygenase-like cupin family protein
MKFVIVLGATLICAPAFAQPSVNSSLMTKALIGDPAKEVRMSVVTSLPGASSPAHRHNGQVFVYMLSGSMVMQVKGKPAVTLTAGQTFYEDPDDIHVVSRNASQTEPAKFLSFLIVKKGAPTTTPEKMPDMPGK